MRPVRVGVLCSLIFKSSSSCGLSPAAHVRKSVTCLWCFLRLLGCHLLSPCSLGAEASD